MKMQVKNGLAARFTRVLQDIEAARLCRLKQSFRESWKRGGQSGEQVRRDIEDALHVALGDEETMSGRQRVDVQKRQSIGSFQYLQRRDRSTDDLAENAIRGRHQVTRNDRSSRSLRFIP